MSGEREWEMGQPMTPAKINESVAIRALAYRELEGENPAPRM